MKHRAIYISLICPAIIILCLTGCTAKKPLIHPPKAIGDQRILVLAVSFPDIQQVKALPFIKQNVFDKTVKYYSIASYGKTELSGDVKGWYELPRPLDTYKVLPYNTQVDRNRVKLLVQDSLDAAEKDISFKEYSQIIIVVGVDTLPGEGYGMIAYCANPGMMSKKIRYGGVRMHEIVTRGGQRFQGGIVVVAQNAHAGHIVHDLAHALGGVVEGRRIVPDLYDTVLQGKIGPLSLSAYPKYTVFMGPWDVMSRHLISHKQPPPGMSSFTRLRMGWIRADQLVEVHKGEKREVTLQPLGLGTGTLVMRIPGPGGKYYLLENRQKVRGDWMVPKSGLLILQVDESREDGDGIVKVVNADPAVPDFGGAAFGIGPGQTSSVSLSPDVAVEILRQQGNDLTVMVTNK